MGKYSVKGSQAFDARIDRELERIVDRVRASSLASEIEAVLLMGGYGRGEGSPCIRGGEEQAFNDYDCVVVSRPGLRGDGVSRVRSGLQALEIELTGELGVTVDLFLHTPASLKRAEFSLMNYEMLYGHRVIWGDADILRWMPQYDLAGLPLVEGTRLLLNRGKLLLDLIRRVRKGQVPGVQSDGEREQSIKFLMKARLAMGDCLLLALGRYHISYQEKRRRIEALRESDIDCGAQPSFDIERVADEFLRGLDFKEWVDFSQYESPAWPEQLEELLPVFLQFYYGYESVRLREGLRDRDRYPGALLKGGSDRAGLRGLLHSVRALGLDARKPGLGWLGVHPRARLYAVLPRLLDPESDLRVACGVLGIPSSEGRDREAVEARFYHLREVLA